MKVGDKAYRVVTKLVHIQKECPFCEGSGYMKSLCPGTKECPCKGQCTGRYEVRGYIVGPLTISGINHYEVPEQDTVRFLIGDPPVGSANLMTVATKRADAEALLQDFISTSTITQH